MIRVALIVSSPEDSQSQPRPDHPSEVERAMSLRISLRPLSPPDRYCPASRLASAPHCMQPPKTTHPHSHSHFSSGFTLREVSVILILWTLAAGAPVLSSSLS